MPVVFDFLCGNPECDARGIRFEKLLRNWREADPECPHCGEPLKRQPAAPKSVWLKPWGEYGARPEDKQSPEYTPEGIKVVRRLSSTIGYDVPQPDFLRTRREVQDFCKAEKLMMPDDVNPNIRINKDGKTMDTRGLKSQWI